jgi:hypothetical protein
MSVHTSAFAVMLPLLAPLKKAGKCALARSADETILESLLRGVVVQLRGGDGCR